MAKRRCQRCTREQADVATLGQRRDKGRCYNESGPGSALTLNRSLTHAVRQHRTEGSMKPIPRTIRDPLILRALAEHPDWFPKRVLARLDGYPGPSCWLWTKYRYPFGYGGVHLPKSVGSAMVMVHRAVWLALRGPIPEGLVLDHDGGGCGNKACANPEHLACVTEWVNTVITGSGPAARNARATHCPKGHPLEEGNLVPSASMRGKRNCLTCGRENARRSRERAAAARAAA